MSDIRQLLKGMENRAGEGADAPDELRTAIQRAAGRRRATREVAGGSLAVVVAGVVAWGSIKLVGGRDVEPAEVSPSPSPTASPSVSPSTSPSPSAAATELAQHDWNPWSVYVQPSLAPATQAAADAVLNPTVGPTVSIGVLESSNSFDGWSEVDCTTVGEACGRGEAPRVTRDVLDRVTPEWDVVADSVMLSENPERALRALYLASPEGEVFTLLDLAALVDQLQVPADSIADMALDAEAGTMMLVQDAESGAHVVLVDLETGETSTVATIDPWSGSVERDGDGWLLWGTNGGTPFAARLAPDAQSWDVDDLWTVSNGTVERVAGRLVVRSGDGLLLAPQPDLSLTGITVPTSPEEQCQLASADDAGALVYCDAGEGSSPRRVTWEGVPFTAPDAPDLPDVPLTRWGFALGDGIIEITPSLAGDNSPVAEGTPHYEWHRPGGTEVIDGPLAFGAQMSRIDGAAVWIRHDLGVAVIDSTGRWLDLMVWPEPVGAGYSHHPQVLDIG